MEVLLLTGWWRIQVHCQASLETTATRQDTRGEAHEKPANVEPLHHPPLHTQKILGLICRHQRRFRPCFPQADWDQHDSRVHPCWMFHLRRLGQSYKGRTPSSATCSRLGRPKPHEQIPNFDCIQPAREGLTPLRQHWLRRYRWIHHWI